MAQTKEILELRKKVPIGITEAKRLLEINSGSVQKSEFQFITESIDIICLQTGETTSDVEEYFKQSDFDVHKCLNMILIIQYDRNFDKSRLLEVFEESFQIMDDWLLVEDHEGIVSALNHHQLDFVLDFIEEKLLLTDVSTALRKASALVANCIRKFEKYGDEMLLAKLNVLKQNQIFVDFVNKLEENRNTLDIELGGLRRNFLSSKNNEFL